MSKLVSNGGSRNQTLRLVYRFSSSAKSGLNIDQNFGVWAEGPRQQSRAQNLTKSLHFRAATLSLPEFRSAK